MSLATDVSRALRWSAVGRIASQAVTWVTTLLVIRILVPEDYGLIALAAAFIGFFSLISEVGLGPALIQSKSLTSEKIREIHGLVVVSCAVIIGFIELLSPVVAEFFSEPRLQLILSVLALQFLFEAFAIVPRNLLVRDLRFKGLAVIEMISRSAAGLGTLFLALHGFGVWSLVYGNLLGIALRAAGVVIATKYHAMPLFRFRRVISEIRFGGAIVIQRIAWWFFSQIDVFIIGRLFSAEILGAYSVAYNLASLPQQKLNEIINQVSFSGFSKIQENRDHLAEYTKTSLMFLLIATMPVFFGISAVSEEIINVIIGSKWSEAIFPLMILPLVLPLRMASAPIAEAVNAVGKPTVVSGNILINIGILGSSLLIGANWGIDGICLSWVFAAPISLYINLLRVQSHIGFGPAAMVMVVWRPFVAAVAMYAAVAGVRDLLPPELNQLAILASLVVAGAVTYCFAIFVVAKHECMAMIEFIRR